LGCNRRTAVIVVSPVSIDFMAQRQREQDDFDVPASLSANECQRRAAHAAR
jgi:hypothetical protein